MNKTNHEILRMELQISELIRIVANLNDRLKALEEIGKDKAYLHLHSIRQRTQHPK